MNIQYFLLQNVQKTLISINLESFIDTIRIQSSTYTQFGDYQINGFITISKCLNIPIEKLATKFIKAFNIHDIAKTVIFKKPGFINIFLNPQWIENQINYMNNTPNLGIINPASEIIIIDYSSPNIAKEMHVGHLRSTVIGDSIARILSFLGHKVIRVNHLGDWGTQFGMLIAYIKKYKLYDFLFNTTPQFSTIEHYYQKAQEEYNTDSNFAKLSRKYVVKLQTGNKYCLHIWKHLVNISIINNQNLYNRLNITLKKSDIMGESAYQHMLPNIIKDLKNKKIAVTSNGAVVVFLHNLHIKKYNPGFGVIIQKQDGGYLYSTTDIACIKYRCQILKANRIIYYTDSRQKQHLIQAWEIAKKAGYITTSTSFEHHACGMLLEEKSGKPFKTRSGNTLKLTELLDEAFNRAFHIIHTKNPNLEFNKINILANTISIGAIKYSELSKNRTTNYIFNWNNMLNFEGNTAPYIQYAYTRILSILKRSNHINIQKKYNIQLYNKEEIMLATYLLKFHEIIITVAHKGTPHVLCTYLYKLSVLFSTFYENCPVLTINDSSIKCSRLNLISLTARILKKGLNLLGIKTTKYM